MTALGGVSAHARSVPSADRERLARLLADHADPGTVLLVTCHRVELYGPESAIESAAAVARDMVGREGSGRLRRLDGRELVHHVVRLAVGLESAVAGEDQILHQLRDATTRARRAGPLDPALGRLLDVALRAGRRARTWLPAVRPSLADRALDLADAADDTVRGPAIRDDRDRDGGVAERATGDGERRVLIVGTGPIGRLAATAARRRGLEVVVAGRTPARAEAIAASVGGRVVGFDPGPACVRSVETVIVALAGPWLISAETASALAASPATVVDLSSPAALPATVATRLGARHRSIDDLARDDPQPDHPGVEPGRSAGRSLARRLESFVDVVVAEHEQWLAGEADRQLARALADRAVAVRTAELEALWSRIPDIDGTARAAIEAMAENVTGRLLRDPLEQLSADPDGRRARAAQELFRL